MMLLPEKISGGWRCQAEGNPDCPIVMMKKETTLSLNVLTLRTDLKFITFKMFDGFSLQSLGLWKP